MSDPRLEAIRKRLADKFRIPSEDRYDLGYLVDLIDTLQRERDERIPPLKVGEVIRFTDTYVLTERGSWQQVHDADVYHIQKLNAKIDELEAHVSRLTEALRMIAGGRCEHYTTGPGSCWRQGNRTSNAEYTGDRWCDACIAFAALASPNQEPQP